MSDEPVYLVEDVVEAVDGSVTATWRLENVPGSVSSEFPSVEEAPVWAQPVDPPVTAKRRKR